MMKEFLTKQGIKILHLDKILNLIQPFSELGKKELKNKKPHLTGSERNVKNEYQKIFIIKDHLKDERFKNNLQNFLTHFLDIGQTLTRLENQITLELFELFEIKNFIFHYQKCHSILREKSNEFLSGNLSDIYDYLDPEQTQTPNFSLSGKYSPILQNIKIEIADNSSKIKQLKIKLLNEAGNYLGRKIDKDEFVISRMNNQLIEKIQNSNYFYLLAENFANLSFKLKKNKKWLQLEENNIQLLNKLKSEEQIIRTKISLFLSDNIERLMIAYREISKLDLYFAKAIFADEYDCIQPNINRNREIKIKSAFNIPILNSLIESNIDYQRIDFDFAQNLNIITGSNMAGKTTAIATIGQIAFMTAFAIPIPATFADVCLFDFIFFSAASEYSHRMDLSSFGAEVVELVNALDKKGFGLFLIDEFARGTNPIEGNAFARAILESFANRDSLIIAVTHFDSPTKIKKAAHYRIVGLQNCPEITDFSNIENRIEYLHKFIDYSLIKVSADSHPPQSALMVAKILGISPHIIDLAKKYIENKK